MKRFFFLLWIMANVSFYAQTPKDNIRNILDLQSEAWNKGDIDGFMKYYWKNEELTFVSKKGVSKGWQQVYDNYKKGYPTAEVMGKLTFEQLEFDRINFVSYMVTGSWSLNYETGTDIERINTGGWFTLVFKKINGSWLIVYDHTS